MYLLKDLINQIKDSLSEDNQAEALRVVADFYSRQVAADQVVSDLDKDPGSVGDSKWDALIAGVVERIFNKRNESVPAWTINQSRFCHPWWFVSPYVALHASAIVNSAPELANRGVFLHADSLESV